MQLVEWPLVHPEIYDHLGVEPPRGVLLCGPSGTGKTKLASAIAGELAAFGVKFFRVSAPSLVTGTADLFCFFVVMFESSWAEWPTLHASLRDSYSFS